MKTNQLLSFALLLLLISCGDKKPSAREALYDHVIAAHDEIMVKMSDIMKYKKQLNGQIDEWREDGGDSVKIAKAEAAIADLEESHEEMMNWMRGFDNNFEGKVNEEVMAYLNDQKQRIEAVGQLTNEALKNAEEALAE
ncbi:MAG: hypothetical protein HC819_04360 [Cyclobacteriaceae bacterium]|nr:hypothetical protein [Cyclobacteriaceae bacterium]